MADGLNLVLTANALKVAQDLTAQGAFEFPQPLTEKYRAGADSGVCQRIVKDSQNNVRASLMALETEIMCA